MTASEQRQRRAKRGKVCNEFFFSNRLEGTRVPSTDDRRTAPVLESALSPAGWLGEGNSERPGASPPFNRAQTRVGNNDRTSDPAMLYPPLANNPLQTRADLQRAMLDLFEPLRPHFSADGARVRPGSTGAHYTSSSVELEAFVRPLWGLIPFAAGGGSFPHWDLYQRGLTHGTDPGHPAFWKPDAYQRFVEMAAIGLGLLQVPEILWEPLSAEAKENLAAWLGTINHPGAHYPFCNWLFFRVFVNVGLRSVGAPYDPAVLEASLADLERQYLADGWYSDGLDGNCDYYIPFAMHFYGLLYARLAGGADPARAERFRERAAVFARDFIHWFAPDGSAVPYGRSMTYRFAQVSFWGALAFAKVEVFSPGIVKGIVLRHLRYWFQQPIFTETGLLTIGYRYPNMFMAENYNAPGSPYWALKSFLPLALAADDPFWTAAEEALPELAPVSEQVHPGMILTRRKASANVVALCGGQVPASHRHTPEKYSKFAYSTAFGFNVPTEPIKLSCRGHDSMLAFSEEGHYWRVRGPVTDRKIEGGIISSHWSPWADVRVTTWLIPFEAWHLRVHRVRAGRALETAEGGFAIIHSDAAKGNHGEDWVIGPGFAGVPEGESFSGIRDLFGVGRQGEIVHADPNSNLLTPGTVIPTLRGRLPAGEHRLATAVLGVTDGSGRAEWGRGQALSVSPEEAAAGFSLEDVNATRTFLNKLKALLAS